MLFNLRPRQGRAFGARPPGRLHLLHSLPPPPPLPPSLSLPLSLSLSLSLFPLSLSRLLSLSLSFSLSLSLSFSLSAQDAAPKPRTTRPRKAVVDDFTKMSPLCVAADSVTREAPIMSEAFGSLWRGTLHDPQDEPVVVRTYYAKDRTLGQAALRDIAFLNRVRGLPLAVDLRRIVIKSDAPAEVRLLLEDHKKTLDDCTKLPIEEVRPPAALGYSCKHPQEPPWR